jgi:hypothetical protein
MTDTEKTCPDCGAAMYLTCNSGTKALFHAIGGHDCLLRQIAQRDEQLAAANEIVEKLRKATPLAWLVYCPRGNEFDSFLFDDKEDAYDKSMEFTQNGIDNMDHDPTPDEEKEIEDRWKPIPLYDIAAALAAKETPHA